MDEIKKTISNNSDRVHGRHPITRELINTLNDSYKFDRTQTFQIVFSVLTSIINTIIKLTKNRDMGGPNYQIFNGMLKAITTFLVENDLYTKFWFVLMQQKEEYMSHMLNAFKYLNTSYTLDFIHNWPV